MTSSQTVQDSVNKYRHGVLIGNFHEEQFGIDSAIRVHNPINSGTTGCADKPIDYEGHAQAGELLA